MTPATTMDFPPPEAAASLYVGDVMHARLKPLSHRFVYKVFSLLVDLDALPAADAASRLFSVGRFNLTSFHESDHGPGDGSALGSHVRRLLERDGVDLEGGRVLLLCYPRILGYVFNPLAVYWCYGADGALKALVYEVTNTFGERHAYVAPIADGELTAAGVRQERDKLLYVSPFIDIGMRYAFRMRPPGDDVRLRILESDAEGPILSATFAGARKPLTGRTLLRLCAAMPLMTLKVVGGIHWEAAKLWFKGLRLVPYVSPPSAASHDMPGPFRKPVPFRHGPARPRARTAAPASPRHQETIAP